MKKRNRSKEQFDQIDTKSAIPDNKEQTGEGTEGVESETEKIKSNTTSASTTSEASNSEEQDKLTIEEKANEYLEQMLRLQAEFDNYRKRVARERTELLRFANEKILIELLPIRDNFMRALSTLEEHVTAENHKFFEGVEMIYRQLDQLMTKNNVVPIQAKGESFNPEYHSAVQQVETDEFPANTVIEELEKGYLFHDKLLRPTTAVVSKEPVNQSEKEKEEPDEEA